MESWNKTKNIYETEEKAMKTANIIEATEGRLASSKKGPQYGVETKIEKISEGWIVLWRNVLLPPNAQGCGSGCGGCGSKPNLEESNGNKNKSNINNNYGSKNTAKIIAFRPRQS